MNCISRAFPVQRLILPRKRTFRARCEPTEEYSSTTIIYSSAVALTFGSAFTWYVFRDQIEDLVYGGGLVGSSISLGDISSVALWTVAYYFISPLQLLFVFLGRFEKERPSDWILYRLGQIFSQPVDDEEYVPPPAIFLLMCASVFGLALATCVLLNGTFGDATWGVSTGIGACMAAGVFEVSRPRRLSVGEKAVLDSQFDDFVEFADARMERTGSCHESEVFKAFRTEVEGYRSEETLSDSDLRRFVQQWAPRSDRTSNGFFKKVSLKPRDSPFK